MNLFHVFLLSPSHRTLCKKSIRAATPTNWRRQYWRIRMSSTELQKLNRRFALRWLVIPACLSTFIAHQIILSKYILPWPYDAQMPTLLRLLLWWRNLSFLLMLLSSVASLPRWQSIIGLAFVVLFLFFYGSL